MIIMLNRCWILVMIMKILFSISLDAIQQQWEVYYDDDTVFRTTPTAFISISPNIDFGFEYFVKWPALTVSNLMSVYPSVSEWGWVHNVFPLPFLSIMMKMLDCKVIFDPALLCLKMFTTTMRMENKRM